MGELLEEESPFPLTDVDKWVLSQTDEEFQLHTWDELKDIVGEFMANVQIIINFENHLHSSCRMVHQHPRTSSISLGC